MMSMIFIVSAVFLLGIALVWRIAFRAGFAEGRSTIPLELIRSIAEHRVSCAGEPADLVAQDLANDLLLPPDEMRRLREIRPDAPKSPQIPDKLRPAS